MFTRLSFANLAKSEIFGYAAQVPFFQARKRLDFKPGLNILVGPNGSGKSTVLKMLGETLCATQGGVSTITESCVHNTIELTPRLGDRSKPTDKLGIKVSHDGQTVVYCDPRQTVGMMG